MVAGHQLVNREARKLESPYVGKETKDTVGRRGHLAVKLGQSNL